MPWVSCFWRWDVTYRGKVDVEELNITVSPVKGTA
jgi:hypothetical protein